MIAVGIAEALEQSLYGGEGGDCVMEEPLTGRVEEGGSRRTYVVWSKVGSIGSSEEVPERNPLGRRIPDRGDKGDDRIWGGVAFVDPVRTGMV